MTAKTSAWFTEARNRSWWRMHGNLQSLMRALGRVIYTTARIKGKETRVRIWIP